MRPQMRQRQQQHQQQKKRWLCCQLRGLESQDFLHKKHQIASGKQPAEQQTAKSHELANL